MLTKDLYYCCHDDEDESNQQWDNAYVECLPEPFHMAPCGCGGHFLLEQKSKKNENPNQRDRTRNRGSGDS